MIGCFFDPIESAKLFNPKVLERQFKRLGDVKVDDTPMVRGKLNVVITAFYAANKRMMLHYC